MPANTFPRSVRKAHTPALALLLLLGLAEAVPAQALVPPLGGTAAGHPRSGTGRPAEQQPAPQGSAPQGSEPQGSEPQDPARQESEPQEPEPQDPARQESEPQEPEPQPECTTGTGPRQREVEGYLGLPVDGTQSPQDCAAIRDFQEREGVLPADGLASPATYRALYARWAAGHPEQLLADAHCPAERGRVACLDLTHQVMWLLKGRKVVVRAVPLRSGAPGYETRTGRFSIQRRVRDDYSTLYHQPMPFSQYFSGGQALHGTRKNIYSPPGSHGCVNLRHDDAERLWNWMRVGDTVRIWGRKPPS
ncbi:L,D-transpeptidase family protein [Streptomyces sp. WMMB303]|uniref:L,D-transpeptidase family protein n=1 Tax=Streptomyces sp. WMMB303 TaxID=3034154 RepID=UPI0023EAFFC3|nr:L,D-transpeptidase family protein [Streptomyces sp. WMMB303]MDF4249616.1 L,D-transpeptidase family protein [Streptomyces sp. WMMB303]